MTNIPSATGGTCPPDEEISAFFDGEAADPVLLQHIEGCPVCRQKVQELRKLDEQIRNACECSDEIVRRTLLRVRSKLKTVRKTKKKLFLIPFPVLARAAAFLILASVFVYLIRTQGVTSGNRKAHHARTAVKTSAGTHAVLSPVSGSGVDAADFSFVSYGPASPVFSEKQSGEQKAVQIPAEVRHVWGGKVPDAEVRLREILRKSGITDFQLRLEDGGMVLLKYSAKKADCVNFVRSCIAAGFQLASPEQPQPEQNRFFGKAEDPVSYQGNFLPEK